MSITNEFRAYSRSYSLPQLPVSFNEFRDVGNDPLSLSCNQVATRILENMRSTGNGFSDRSFDIKLLNDAHARGLMVNPIIPPQNCGLTVKQYDMAETCGITLSEFAYLKKFYNTYSYCLDFLSAPIFIPRNYYPEIPFSLVLNPAWSNEAGIYVLLKTHAAFDEVNSGSFYKVTWALELNKSELYVFRSALLEKISLKEKDINARVSEYPSFFVSGTPLYYKGNWRCRCSNCFGIKKLLDSEDYRRLVKQEKNVEKIGFMMKYEEQTLWQKINDEFSPLSRRKCCRIAQKYASTLSFLHQLNIIHCDQKPQNIFLSEDGVKLGDFGFGTIKGRFMHGLGTKGYIAPEMSIRDSKGEVCVSDFSVDIWGYGCVCADLFNTGWTSWCYKRDKARDWHTITQNRFEKVKGFYFPHRQKLNHPHFIIDQCLQLLPEKRPTAAAISKKWKKISAYKKKVISLKKELRKSL